MNNRASTFPEAGISDTPNALYGALDPLGFLRSDMKRIPLHGKYGEGKFALVDNDLLHRLIMGNPSGVLIDHRDINTLNCQKSNLRYCTIAQNNRNRKSSCNLTGFKGVSIDKRTGKYQAQIYVNRRRITFKACQTAEEAAAVYDAAALEHYGEFAQLNFPQPSPASPPKHSNAP